MSQFTALIFGIVNFVILCVVLRKFLRQPVSEFFASRSKSTHQAIEAAHAKRLHIESELKVAQQRQQNLNQELSQLKQQLENICLHERDLMMKRANEQAERISRESKMQVEQDRLRIQQEIRHKVLVQGFAQAENELKNKADSADKSVSDSLHFLGTQLSEPTAQVGGNA